MRTATPAPKAAERRRISLAALLALTFGALVAAAVGAVLYLSVSSNFANTFSLLNRRTLEIVAALEMSIREDAAEVERGLVGAATLLESAAPAESLDAAMRALLAATPAVDGLLVADADGNLVSGHVRLAEGGTAPIGRADADAIRKIADEAKSRPLGAAAPGSAYWGNPARIGGIGAIPVVVATQRGLAVALASARSLDRLVASNAEIPDMTVFVLDGEGKRVIAHSRVAKDFEGGAPAKLSEFPDPNLRLLGEARVSPRFETAGAAGVSVRITDGRQGFVFVTKPLNDVVNVPIQIGAYFAKAQIGSEILAATLSLIAGLVALFLSVAVAVLLGRRIARPMTAVAGAAAALSDFRISEMAELPQSHIREIDDQAAALNALRKALVEFARYVPRQFVARLVRIGEEAKRPVERKLTVMFTDIVGFTAMSEKIGAQESARILNRHFDMLTREIEATRGTVDKFMGDGLMAFWGAPEADKEHARHAVEAAHAIVRALAADNAERLAQGQWPVRLRIGVHSGRAIVGNIGGGERVNYTVVGDAVNVAQRLEQLGKEITDRGAAVAVNVSLATAKLAGTDCGLTGPRSRTLPGRDGAVAVCGLTELETIVAAKSAGNLAG